MQYLKSAIGNFIYRLIIRLHYFLILIASIYHWKAKKWINGRKKWKSKLISNLSDSKPKIWICCPSIGEFQECKIFVKKITEKKKNHQIVYTFHSPSGFDQAVIPGEDYIRMMLPIDTVRNAKKFIGIVNPEQVFILATGIWPNYLRELSRKAIPHYLISFYARKNSSLFRPCLKFFYRPLFSSFSTIFCYNETGKELLHAQFGYDRAIPINNMRFDSIIEMKKNIREIKGISEFVNGKFCFVAGSTEKPEDLIITNVIKQLSMLDMKWIIVPHEKLRHVLNRYQKILGDQMCFYSRGFDTSKKILVYDITGDLFQLYRFANISLVGRGFEVKEIHNMIEPAIFEIPVLIGPMHKKFIEPKLFIKEELAFEFNNEVEFKELVSGFYNGQRSIDTNKTKRIFEENSGGIEIVMKTLENHQPFFHNPILIKMEGLWIYL